MKPHISCACAVSLVLMTFCHKSAAQTGPDLNAVITGTVVDEKSPKPLPFVTVALEGKGIGTTTDHDGRFVLSNLPAGTYNLLFS